MRYATDLILVNFFQSSNYPFHRVKYLKKNAIKANPSIKIQYKYYFAVNHLRTFKVIFFKLFFIIKFIKNIIIQKNAYFIILKKEFLSFLRIHRHNVVCSVYCNE